MFISMEEEQISLSSAYEGDLLKSSSIESIPKAINELSEASALPATFTDVNIVPEYEKIQLEQNIVNLQEEIMKLRLRERSLDEKRRESLNKILDIKGCIRVFCRVKPFLSTDKRKFQQPISTNSDKIMLKSGGTRKEFGFDKVFHQKSSQDDVFMEVQPILRSALDGHNVCILSYGQTGTGKTFTMEGTNESPGIIPRALEQLFQEASQDTSVSYTFSISMLEVYLGSLRDLLVPRPSSKTYGVSKCNLNIHTDPKGSVEIEPLMEVEVSNSAKANWWYNKGRRIRSTSWTNVNQSSSRSHCLTRITIYRDGVLGRKGEVSKMWMVDLGGSERLLKTGATGQTLDEGRAINLSLSALGDVIAALKRKKSHVPYRNSKLTQILKDSLGDGSKVVMLLHVSPYEDDVGETTCSFTFAKRVRAVECGKELPEDLKKQREEKIEKIEEEMKGAEEESRELRDQILKLELSLNENKTKLMRNYPTLETMEDEEKNPLPLKEYPEELLYLETPKRSEKGKRKAVENSLPRFMNPTVASNLRRSTADRESGGRVKSVRSWNTSSVQISGSQSISYSDPRYKAFLRNSEKKSRYSEAYTIPGEVGKSPGFDLNPRPKVTLGQHRRRMSDFN